MLFGQHDTRSFQPIQLTDRMRASRIVEKSPWRLVADFGLGDQPTRRRVPPGELDACCFANQAAPAVAPDEIPRPPSLTAGHHDVDAIFVLRETGHFTPTIDRYPEF